jgi:hypothetical protein
LQIDWWEATNIKNNLIKNKSGKQQQTGAAASEGKGQNREQQQEGKGKKTAEDISHVDIQRNEKAKLANQNNWTIKFGQVRSGHWLLQSISLNT